MTTKYPLLQAESGAPIVIPNGKVLVSNGDGTFSAGSAVGGGYANIEVNGVPFPPETTVNLTGPGVTGSDGGGITTVDFQSIQPEVITSFSHSPATVQIGASVVNPAFTATYNNVPTTATLTDNQGHTNDVTGTPNAFVSPHTFTFTAYGASVLFTLAVTSPGGNASRSFTEVWAQKVWWGAQVDPGIYDSAFINGLSNEVLQLGPSGAFAVNAGAGESTFYTARTAFGVTALNFKVNGLPFAISKVGSAIPYTNSDGVTENYDVWRSDNVALGAFTFTES